MKRKERHPDFMADIPVYIPANDPMRHPNHLKFVRKHNCAVPGCQTRPVVAHHVRDSYSVVVPKDERGGIGMKPHDKWTVPLCDQHHKEVHTGPHLFENDYKISLIQLAADIASRSPYREGWE